ncbi:YbaB/EbfC family nucleoid-associated protein [Lentzea flava]|uniref:YbaB/EbfC DNA-binding family protein n=1 Tax=Lentzea flava TaxID=103732 RepID=A0ABQ2V3D2_9PSEU|nr:YbaB/EbfC family nucleoid-associated protein [Lentzea flava]MCP2203234.1 Conserved DNA-binding protein YbaB [Lentzea flava]GGU66639.1 hypothetical protein GCM10010178_68110 [Lentzea flava]
MTRGMNLFGSDPSEVERGLDEWVAGFERKAARYQELQHRVEEVRLSATSSNGVATVTVDANGNLVDIRFSDRIVQTTPDELRAQVLGALKRAKTQIAARVREVADDTLGPEARDSADRITGYYEQKFGAPDEPPPPPPRDDEDYGGSIYR